MDIILGIMIPFIGTTLGAACVFFLKDRLHPAIQKILLGFASGVMVAASVWSLISPAIDLSEGMGKLSEDPLQNIRYHFVVTTAMITRYCVHGGMEQEKAYSLSDFYILKMDSCKSIQEISKLHDTMCIDMCKQMNIIRNSQILSKPIVLCIDYIYSHIHYRITIKELADHLHLSESYLSKLFSKEMGISLSQYILDLKIEKAKNLLQYSEYNIVDIANYLSFSSQSHFIQVFQKKTGLTPHKYRTQNFRQEWQQMAQLSATGSAVFGSQKS